MPADPVALARLSAEAITVDECEHAVDSPGTARS